VWSRKAENDAQVFILVSMPCTYVVFEWRQKGWSRCSKECGGGGGGGGRQRMTLRYSFWFPCPVHIAIGNISKRDGLDALRSVEEEEEEEGRE
jgi:hypothetical protein